MKAPNRWTLLSIVLIPIIGVFLVSEAIAGDWLMAGLDVALLVSLVGGMFLDRRRNKAAA